jgi:SecD/SecF fusion protein
VAYLSFRFEFKYAIPTIVALFHDVIITIGVYSLTGRVVTAATVAAVLTVLGYSLYDTIIVFDRVRENTPLLRKNSFPQIVNVSIWETLTRSLNTSLITLFPIATLLVFGGATLKDFAFALLIGIAAGAYSSIFIAAPLLSMWKGHEAEFRRRQATSIEKATLGTVAPAFAGTSTATAAVPVTKKADGLSETVPVPELSDEEREAREAAKRRRDERRRKQGRGHGRRT